ADLAHALHFGIRPWKRNSIFSVAVICILCGLAGCSAAPLVGPHDGSASRTDVIYVISGGWHTQLGFARGGDKGSVGRSEGGISERRLPCLRLGSARLLHGSKSWHRRHSPGRRVGT